jgi:outer membrane protein OmpA-like peptidoglycan-associated protein
LSVVLGGVAACQPAAPSRELVTARRIYERARQSPAPAIDPQSMREARASLQAAEAVHAQAPGSQRERSHAYISARQSELAMSRTRQAAALVIQERIARARGAMASQAEAEQTRAQLEQRERQLGAALVALAITQAALEQQQSQVRVTGVFFETGRDELSPTARRQLDIVANQLTANPELGTVIEGFADTRGDSRQNLELSARRAHRVREYLASRGVDSGRLEAVGFGENYPAATNATPTGRAANRRAEISTGADQSRPSSGEAAPDTGSEPQPPQQPELQPNEESPRQPVRGQDSDYPDDPKTPGPDVDGEPR